MSSYRRHPRSPNALRAALVLPHVQTEPGGAGAGHRSRAMPLGEFTGEIMAILSTRPDMLEMCVERAKPMRFAEAGGTYHTSFKQFNDSRAAAARGH